MHSDPLFNTVYRARQRGCDPCRIGEDVWEARCPVCRREHALVLERGSLVTCRSPKKCRNDRVLEALRLPGKAAYHPTPPEVFSELRGMPIHQPTFGAGSRMGNDQAGALETCGRVMGEVVRPARNGAGAGAGGVWEPETGVSRGARERPVSAPECAGAGRYGG